MAAKTLSIVTPTISGASITATGAVASSDTMTISCTTAQSSIDFSSLAIRVENQSSTAAVTLSLAAGANFSSIGIGAKSISIGTATTVVLGGQTFESARFLKAAGTIVFTQAGTGPTSWEAYQSPRATE